MEGITTTPIPNSNMKELVIEVWKLKEMIGEKFGIDSSEFILKINSGGTLPSCERVEGFYFIEI